MSELICSSIVSGILLQSILWCNGQSIIYVNGTVNTNRNWVHIFQFSHLTLWILYYHSLYPFLLLIRWQSSRLEGSTLTSSLSKIFKRVLSLFLLLFVSGILVKNSDYSSSTDTRQLALFLNTDLACLATDRSEPSFSKSFFQIK